MCATRDKSARVELYKRAQASGALYFVDYREGGRYASVRVYHLDRGLPYISDAQSLRFATLIGYDGVELCRVVQILAAGGLDRDIKLGRYWHSLRANGPYGYGRQL